MDDKIRLGVIGCGNILSQYVEGCRAFDILELVACADIDQAKAEQAAHEYGIQRALPVGELLADESIDLVINLTVPLAHAEVSLAILAAGKHLYSEKPLAVEREEGRRILETAAAKGLRVGCAPDTFLGGGQQTCRKLLDDGWIGQPVGATAFMLSSGPESWHPSPEFFYQPGAGPLFDMAPYYLTALINFFGPVSRVTGETRISFPERTITSPGRFGQRIPVDVPSHSTALLAFESGPIAVLVTSFDVQGSTLPRIELYGSQGTLVVPDPNIFGGPVQLLRAGDRTWHEMPLSHSPEVGRGIGVADMAHGLRRNQPHRASGELAYHVLDIMQAVEEASQTGRHIYPDSQPGRPEPLPMGSHPSWP